MPLKLGCSRYSASIKRRSYPARQFFAVFFVLSFVVAPVSAALMPVTTNILNEQRAKWALAGITSYVYEGSAECFCLPEFVAPHRVTVTNGVVTELLFADTLLPDGSPDSLRSYLPIEGLFDFLQGRIDGKWMTVEAMFDPALGYPVMLFTDLSAQIADDQYGFRIESLTSVPVPVPGTVPLLLLSLLGVVGFGRRWQMGRRYKWIFLPIQVLAA